MGGFSDAPVFWSNLNQIYDTQTDSWSLGTPAPSSVTDESAGATTGVMAPKQIHVLGVPAYNGLGSPSCLNQVYDTENDSWTDGINVPTSSLNLGVAVVNDKLYAIGRSYSRCAWFYHAKRSERAIYASWIHSRVSLVDRSTLVRYCNLGDYSLQTATA